MIPIGHTKQIEHLDRALRAGAAPSASLFFGPAHIGKRIVAEYFARAIIDGAMTIDFSQRSKRDYYGDLIMCAPVVEKQKIKQKKKTARKSVAKKAEEKTVTHDISVDQVRSAVRELSLSSLHGKARVLIVDDAERLGTVAQNALLKTVEEPPANAYVIFVTSDVSRLLPTLRSRCQMTTFGLLGDDILSELSSDAQLRARAMGRPGLLAALIEEKKTHKGDRIDTEQERLSRESSVADRLAYAQELSNDKERARNILAELQWRMRAQIFKEQSYEDYTKLEQIEETRRLLRTNVNTRMVLEELFLHL